MILVDIDTPRGPARVHLYPVAGARAALVLGHGAGGGVTAPDLEAASRAGQMVGASVALVEQPYRVAGRRSPPRAALLDEAWIAVCEQLAAGKIAGLPHKFETVPQKFGGLPLVTGGRSSGARVACRTAAATGSVGVLCLAFPLIAPSGTSRQEELDGAGVPVLVVQGASDRFGMPEPADGRSVVVLTGDHGLKSDLPGVGMAVAQWLPGVIA